MGIIIKAIISIGIIGIGMKLQIITIGIIGIGMKLQKNPIKFFL